MRPFLTHLTFTLADVISPPSRPRWNDPPAPLPLPPEALAAIAFALLLGLAWYIRGRRAARARS